MFKHDNIYSTWMMCTDVRTYDVYWKFGFLCSFSDLVWDLKKKVHISTKKISFVLCQNKYCKTPRIIIFHIMSNFSMKYSWMQFCQTHFKHFSIAVAYCELYIQENQCVKWNKHGLRVFSGTQKIPNFPKNW